MAARMLFAVTDCALRELRHILMRPKKVSLLAFFLMIHHWKKADKLAFLGLI
jgi:hypothetical protein